MSEANEGLRVIVGLGKTGISCARYLARKNIPFAMTDSRENPPGLETIKKEFPHCVLSLGKFDKNLLESAKEIVLSQGVSLLEPVIVGCRDKGIPIIGDLELFAREATNPIVAITGSNAKSTVTTLVGQMARDKNVLVGGNIGIPVLDLLVQPAPDYYILETSNFQLEVTQSLQPAVACLLNISPDHLDCYHDYEDYIKVKRHVYDSCKMAVFNRQDPLTHNDVPRQISFGLDQPCESGFGLRQVNGYYFLGFEDENLLDTREVALPGRQNWQNALAALAIGYGMGLSMDVMLEAVKNFKGLPHRCQLLTQHQGVAWYNDSKGTNVGATQAALSGLGDATEGKLILLAGGLAKGADFTPLVPLLNEHVRDVILFGRDAQLIADVFSDSGSELHFVPDLEEAVAVAKRQAQSGDIVLLSPACASFDMFDNFEQRGQVFAKLVDGVIHGER